ncbi:MAG: AI-2E family transporter [Candidatus Jacksonbacteria bacterium]
MQNLNITYSSLIRVVVVLLAIIFLYFIRDIILILFLSIILSSALDPWVSWLERRHFPRSFGIIAVYVLLFTVISVMGVLISPAVSSQIKVLAHKLPGYYQQAVGKWNLNIPSLGFADSQNIDTISSTMNSLAGKVIPAARGIFGGGFTVFLVLVLTFYLSVEDRGLKRFFRSILPINYQPYFTRVMNKIQRKMGSWLRGQLFLSLVIFLITATSLFVINFITGAIPYWLVLALIAGILEIIPFLGPFLSGIIAVLLVVGSSPWVAVAVIILYFVVQQLENHILVPKVMQKTVGLNPIVIILVIVIGGRLAGILGALIAIPVAAAAQVFLGDFMGREEAEIPTHLKVP